MDGGVLFALKPPQPNLYVEKYLFPRVGSHLFRVVLESETLVSSNLINASPLIKGAEQERGM